MTTTLFRIACLIGLLQLIGCGSSGPKVYPVTGEVVFEDGVVLQGGLVEFSSAERDMSATGRIGPDGTFRLTTVKDGDGAIAGLHRAIVITTYGDDVIQHHHDAKTLRRAAKKFASYATSGLKFTVTPGEKNHFRVVVERAK